MRTQGRKRDGDTREEEGWRHKGDMQMGTQGRNMEGGTREEDG